MAQASLDLVVILLFLVHLSSAAFPGIPGL